MKLTITEKVFVPVSVKDELPNEAGNYLTILKNGAKTSNTFFETKIWGKDNSENSEMNTTHWLKEETNKYVLSREELEKVINNAFNAGELHNENKKDIFYTEASTYFKDFKQYINSIL